MYALIRTDACQCRLAGGALDTEKTKERILATFPTREAASPALAAIRAGLLRNIATDGVTRGWRSYVTLDEDTPDAVAVTYHAAYVYGIYTDGLRYTISAV